MSTGSVEISFHILEACQAYTTAKAMHDMARQLHHDTESLVASALEKEARLLHEQFYERLRLTVIAYKPWGFTFGHTMNVLGVDW